MLRDALADVHTAARAGTRVTGSGRLESFSAVPVPRMSNIRIEMDDVRLKFTKPALRALAQKAIERESGARGLRAILEESMLEIMYEVPSKKGVKEVVVSDEVVAKKNAPHMVIMDDKADAG